MEQLGTKSRERGKQHTENYLAASFQLHSIRRLSEKKSWRGMK